MRPLNCLLVAAISLLAVATAEAEPSAPLSCTVVADLDSGKVVSRSGICDRRFSPVSSFKLALAIMGFDSGILRGPHDPVWELKTSFNASQREQVYKKVDPALWVKDSIVWFSQQLTTKLGKERFAGYVTGFDYGNMDVGGDAGAGNGLTHAWLMSSLRISPDEQIRFLRRFLRHELPVSDRAVALTEATIATYPGSDGWRVQGKSGSGWLNDENGGIDRSKPQGWFIGWAEKGGRKVVFARFLVGEKASDTPGGTTARETFLADIGPLMRLH